MTSGNNGASTPEDDDPFGYLYADGQANGAQPPSGGGYGYPNSVNRVRAVGERRYGAQQTAQQPVPPAGPGYGRPNPHYQAPETTALGSVGAPGGPAAPGHRSHGGGGGRGRGPNTKGLMIGAVAVVAAVVVGITIAMTGGDDTDNGADGGPSPTASSMEKPTKAADDGKDKKNAEFDPVRIDAASLSTGLAGGAVTASDVPGAGSEGGAYVGGLTTPGSSVTWTVNGVPEGGQYTLFTYYGVPGEDTKGTLTVNDGTPADLNMKNHARAEKGDWAKGWTYTYNYIQLNKGTNTVTLSCPSGCNANLAQFGLVKGQVADEPKFS